MAMKKEALTNLIADDLAKRNENWTEIDTTFGLKADKTTTYTKTEVDTSLDLKADKTYVDTQDLLKADKTEVTALTAQLAEIANENRKLINVIKESDNLRFLLPLQEPSGVTAFDYSGNNNNANLIDFKLNKMGPNHRIDSVASLNGVSSMINLPFAGVHGLGRVTLFFLFNMTGNQKRRIWFESTSYGMDVTRFSINVENNILNLLVRSGSSVGSSTDGEAIINLSTTELTTGYKFVHCIFSPADKFIKIYVNGELKAEKLNTFAYNTFLGGPALQGPKIGHGPLISGETGEYLESDVAYIGMYTDVLTDEAIAHQALCAGVS